jgi:transcriptional regulator with XRE-family HTH domain
MNAEDFHIRRRRMGLTQKELAERLDLSAIHISRLERGVSKISTVIKYAMDGLWIEFISNGE